MSKAYTIVGIIFVALMIKAQASCPVQCEDNERCSPESRCVSACNPQCMGDKVCSDDGECVVEPKADGQAASVPERTAPNFWIQIGGGGGYTLVDLATATGESNNNITNGNQGHYSFSARGLLSLGSSFRLGVEAGYEQLYYAAVTIPYVPSPIYREYNEGTTFFGAIGQWFLAGPLFVIGGVDLHIFNNGVAPGVSGGLGLEFRLGGLAIPLEFRAKPVFGDGTPTALQVNTGLSFGLGGG